MIVKFKYKALAIALLAACGASYTSLAQAAATNSTDKAASTKSPAFKSPAAANRRCGCDSGLDDVIQWEDQWVKDTYPDDVDTTYIPAVEYRTVEEGFFMDFSNWITSNYPDYFTESCDKRTNPFSNSSCATTTRFDDMGAIVTEYSNGSALASYQGLIWYLLPEIGTWQQFANYQDSGSWCGCGGTYRNRPSYDYLTEQYYVTQEVTYTTTITTTMSQVRHAATYGY
jgi:hypothetical protein